MIPGARPAPAGADREAEVEVIGKKVETAVNDQINKELFSAYLYLSMSAWCEAQNLPGAAKWLRQQAREEVGHGMKFFEFLNDRGGRIVLTAIEKPAGEFGSLRELFDQALAHERKVSESIHQLYALAARENDYASLPLLQEFVSEQIEEEKTAALIAEQLKRAGDESAALLFLDHQLGERTPGSN